MFLLLLKYFMSNIQLIINKVIIIIIFKIVKFKIYNNCNSNNNKINAKKMKQKRNRQTLNKKNKLCKLIIKVNNFNYKVNKKTKIKLFVN